MDETFGKNEKLKSKKLISQVFAQGSSFTIFPLKLVYLRLPLLHTVNPDYNISVIKVGVTVPKRNFPKASDRIHLKRLMREAYRKNKYLVCDQNPPAHAFMFLYIGKERADYHELTAAMIILLERFLKKELK